MTRIVLMNHDDEPNPVAHVLPPGAPPHPLEVAQTEVHEECGLAWSEHDNTRRGWKLPFGCPSAAAVWEKLDAIEAEWREAYPDADELELRRLAGDR